MSEAAFSQHLDLTTRGRILREPSAAPGLVSIDGQPTAFTLEAHWRSDEVPKAGMVVNVALDAAGALVRIAPVPEAELAKDELKRLGEASKQRAKAAFDTSQRLAAPVLGRIGAEIQPSALTARFGLPTLIAWIALVLGWTVLDFATVHVSQGATAEISFWKLLAFLHVLPTMQSYITEISNGMPPYGMEKLMADGTGWYGAMAVAAMAGPVLPFFWQHRRAYLGNFLPLAFFIYVFAAVGTGIWHGIEAAKTAMHAQADVMSSLLDPDMRQPVNDVSQDTINHVNAMANRFAESIWTATTLDLGLYLLIAACLYFAGRGILKALVARA